MLVDERDEKYRPGPFGGDEPAEAEDDAALVLPRHSYREGDEKQHDDDDDYDCDDGTGHGVPFLTRTGRADPRGLGYGARRALRSARPRERALRPSCSP